jgi:cobalt-zinc-cadmium efflux system outer membrane protein
MQRPVVLTFVAVVVPMAFGVGAGAQQSVTREQAIAAALGRGARLAIARADTAAARAQLLTARQFQNPSVAPSYTKAVPQYHAVFDVPLDYPWLRRSRIGTAQLSRGAALYRFSFERAAVAFDAETTYTRALVSEARQRISSRNALDADSLLTIARVRALAGDASDLDVQLATVNAGQQTNLAANDSLTRVSALLDLQTIMGLPAADVTVVLADSLVALPYDSLEIMRAAGGGVPLQVLAAETSLRAAEENLKFERQNVFGPPSATIGIENRDPTGAERGILPTLGFAVPLPLFNHNQGPIATAQAERDRAFAELTLIRAESQAQIARAVRERTIAARKVERDRLLLTSANQVTTMSLTAYREGAVALTNVLEAQRTAREILSQYVEDVAAANIAAAAVRLFTLTAAPQ